MSLPGIWSDVWLLAEQDGKGFFEWQDASNNCHLYAWDGEDWVGVTPPGSWASIRFVAEQRGTGYFALWNDSVSTCRWS